MKTSLLLLSLALASLAAGCMSLNQAEASAVYIASEAATAALLQKHPETLPTVQLVVTDGQKFLNGTLTSQDEAVLLNTIVVATKSKLTPVQAATLDGAMQQILANRNATAPTALSGAAGAIIQTVLNGMAREIQVYTLAQATPAGP